MGRQYITQQYFPDEITIDEFIDLISNKETNDAFIANLKKLNLAGAGIKTYPERWLKTYQMWMELHYEENK